MNRIYKVVKYAINSVIQYIYKQTIKLLSIVSKLSLRERRAFNNLYKNILSEKTNFNFYVSQKNYQLYQSYS